MRQLSELNSANIFDAIEKDELEIVKKLTEKNPTVVNAAHENGYTPIMLAIELEKIEIISHLIDRGATIGEEIYSTGDLLVNFIRSREINPEDKTKIIKSLITANKDLIDTPIDYKNSTLLMHACRNGKLNPLVKFLINNGAGVNTKNNEEYINKKRKALDNYQNDKRVKYSSSLFPEAESNSNLQNDNNNNYER